MMSDRSGEDEHLQFVRRDVPGESDSFGSRRQADEAERSGLAVPLPRQPTWPEEVGPPPEPAGSGSASLIPYMRWLTRAGEILAARTASARDDLDRLASQWVHVLGNIEHLRPDELNTVVESQARAREVIANDAALYEVLRQQRLQLEAWSDALGGPLTDPGLIVRLLDEIGEERDRVATQILTTAVDTLSGVTLDLEVVQRQLRREPGMSDQLLSRLRERLARDAEALRDNPTHVDVHQPLGEPLVQTLRRILERTRGIRPTLRWSGPEVRDPEAATAMLWVTHECAAHLSVAARDKPVEVSVETHDGQIGMRMASATTALVPDGDPSWLVRSRARVAIARGRLLCGHDSGGSFVEVRFR